MTSALQTREQDNLLTSPILRKKIARAAAAALYEDQALKAASVSVVGVAIAALGIIVESECVSRDEFTVPRDDLIAELVGRGLEFHNGHFAIEYLLKNRVLTQVECAIGMPVIQSELAKVLPAFENRRDGWKKRAATKRVVKKQDDEPKLSDPAKAAADGSASTDTSSPVPPSVNITGAAAETAAVVATKDAVAQSSEAAATVAVIADQGVPAALAGDQASEGAEEPLSASNDLAGDAIPSAKPAKAPARQLTGSVAKEGDSVVAVMVTDDRGSYEVTQSYVDEVSAVFTKIDVGQQLLVAAQWINANPTRRKTVRGMPRFINSWLTRANANATTVRGTVAPVRNGFGQGTVDQVPVVAANAVKDGLDDLESLDTVFEAPAAGEVVLAASGESFDAPVGPQNAGDDDSEISDLNLDAFLSDPQNTGSFDDAGMDLADDLGGLDADFSVNLPKFPVDQSSGVQASFASRQGFSENAAFLRRAA